MIKTIDLFAGAGGLSYGFKMTGKFQFVAAAEINKNAQKTYKKNIANGLTNFEFIDNVIGFDFDTLNKHVGGIDVVIGGPPCQGFSNANRQKKNLISMNNGLVKDYFRAIKQIRPKAFVMENVSMLRSETHRFYESVRDNAEIDMLIEKGFSIPKREDTLMLTCDTFEGVDLNNLEELDIVELQLPQKLAHYLSVLWKNLHNPRRLPNFIKKNGELLRSQIEKYIQDTSMANSDGKNFILEKLTEIKLSLDESNPADAESSLEYIVKLQKLMDTLQEIRKNGLIGEFNYSLDTGLTFRVNSYSVIDYINAILGDEYVQKGDTVNAEWFGVPQERRRHIIIGIRKDIYDKSQEQLKLPEEPEQYTLNTVADAINDLAIYEAGYEKDYAPIDYVTQTDLSDFAQAMRACSTSVKNHITTKTSDIAMNRFKKIKPGKNFHSLDAEDKSTYSKPDRTQNTIYLRLDPARPSGTVVNVRKSMWIHPVLDRAITVREAARLQSFPDSFEFIGTKDSQYQQVGNAVPPLLAKGIAEIVLQYLSDI